MTGGNIKMTRTNKQHLNHLRRRVASKTCQDFSESFCSEFLKNIPQVKCLIKISGTEVSKACRKSCGLCSESSESTQSDSDSNGSDGLNENSLTNLNDKFTENAGFYESTNFTKHKPEKNVNEHILMLSTLSLGLTAAPTNSSTSRSIDNVATIVPSNYEFFVDKGFGKRDETQIIKTFPIPLAGIILAVLVCLSIICCLCVRTTTNRKKQLLGTIIVIGKTDKIDNIDKIDKIEKIDKKEESTKIIDTEDEDDNNSTLSSFFTNSHTGVSTDFSDKSTIVMKNIDSKICNSKVDVTSNKKIVEPLENSSSDVFIKKYKQEIKFTDIESLSFNSKLENALENYTKKKKNASDVFIKKYKQVLEFTDIESSSVNLKIKYDSEITSSNNTIQHKNRSLCCGMMCDASNVSNFSDDSSPRLGTSLDDQMYSAEWKDRLMILSSNS